MVERLSASPPWKDEVSLSEGSSFSSSIRYHIPRLVGSKEAQRTISIKEMKWLSSITFSPIKERGIIVSTSTIPLSPQSSWEGASLTLLKLSRQRGIKM